MQEENLVAVLVINTMADLKSHEKEILGRLGAKKNGGLLFWMDPLSALADIGVKLSADLQAELRKSQSLPVVSNPSYALLRDGKAESTVNVRVRGLFGMKS